MNLTFGAAVILYNPTQDQVDNIFVYQKVFDVLFIFDNSDSNKHITLDFSGYKNIVYMTENKNMGLPYAFNKIIRNDKCRELNFLCTLDQDSIFHENEIRKLIKKIKSINNLEKYGIFSPYINYGNDIIKCEEKLVNKQWVITSGSFINLINLYKYNIYFDENYFIDRCDVDLCKQFLENNCSVCVYFNSILLQQLGENDNKNHSNHSILRHYYIFRNRFYFNNKWYSFPKKQIYDFFQTIKHIFYIFFYESNKFRKIVILKKAFLDYKYKKMGKIDSLK